MGKVTDRIKPAPTGIRVCVVNPKQINDFAQGLAVRTKTNGVDAFTLARFGHLVNPLTLVAAGRLLRGRRWKG